MLSKVSFALQLSPPSSNKIFGASVLNQSEGGTNVTEAAFIEVAVQSRFWSQCRINYFSDHGLLKKTTWPFKELLSLVTHARAFRFGLAKVWQPTILISCAIFKVASTKDVHSMNLSGYVFSVS